MPAAVQLFFKTEWIFRNNLIQPYFELKFCETRNITTKDWSSNNCLVFVHRNTDTDTSFRVFGFFETGRSAIEKFRRDHS